MTENGNEPKLAQSFSLDLPRITAIEFPGNVVNNSRAIDMLGSQNTVAKTCASRGDKQLELRFRPDDPYQHPIISSSSKAQNIVLKISIPKKDLEKANGDIQKAINLAKDKVKFSPEYIADTNYRFRELSDFQYNTKNSKFVQNVKNSILTGKYEKIKDFDFDYNEKFDKFEGLDIPPPPRFSPISYPFNYRYRQNPSLVAIDDGKGGQMLVNRNKPVMLHAQYILWDDEPPKEHSKELQELTDPNAIECRRLMEELFEQRPMWTRRSIEYHLPKKYRIYMKTVIHYVSYSLQEGPWRNAVVKYGVDTRSLPEFRIYQTRRFGHGFKQSETYTDPPYVFDGENMMDGSIVQFCDITDPDIVTVIENAPIRETVDKEAGYFEDLDYRKIKMLLHLKYKAIAENKEPDPVQVRNIVHGTEVTLNGKGKTPSKSKSNESGSEGSDEKMTESEPEPEPEESDDNNDNNEEDKNNQTQDANQIIPISRDYADSLRDLSGIVRPSKSQAN